MTPVKLQTTQMNLALSKINVNGRHYDVDKSLCVVVNEQADADRLMKLGWSAHVTDVKPPKVSTLIVPGTSLRGAEEFVELIQQDAALAAKLAEFKTFAEVASYALTMGFKFLERDLQKAGQAYADKMTHAANIDAANAAKLAAPPEATNAPVASPGENVDPENMQLVTSEFSALETLPETMPEETSGNWPDPTDAMSLPYLKRMADAYKVKYAASISKPALLKKLDKVVFQA